MTLNTIARAMNELRELVNPQVPPELRPKNEIHIHVFDNPKTVDRYTVYVRTSPLDKFGVFTMSDNPLSPEGINQYSHDVDTPAGIEDMATAIPFGRLPFDVVLAIIERAKLNDI